ncbi:hypothetical protein F5Y16DRAFT_399356 [Xylariaceae sp. FL0255]|nr:hypothetical protein F5Y16DRAFT_399356 [Xylariaceae sp. FL0255]
MESGTSAPPANALNSRRVGSPPSSFALEKRVVKRDPAVRVPQANPSITMVYIAVDPRASTDEIMSQVHGDLEAGQGGSGHPVELCGRESSSYIRCDVATKAHALGLIRSAQRQTSVALNGQDSMKTMFVEPPSPGTTHDDFHVIVAPIPGSKNGRYHFEPKSGTPILDNLESLSSEYTNEISAALSESLDKASGLYSSLCLRVHLGHFTMNKYKSQSYDIKGFAAMVADSRCSGRLDTCIGDSATVDKAMHLIHARDSPLVPVDNQIPHTDEVVPAYSFHIDTGDNISSTSLIPVKESRKSEDKRMTYQLLWTKVCQKVDKIPEVDITSLGVAKGLDWTIEAKPHVEEGTVPSGLRDYLARAQVVTEGDRTDFHIYPQVILSHTHALAREIESVRIRSVFRYFWTITGYVVKFTIDRHWASIKAMTQGAEPTTTFEVTICGEHWGDQTSKPPEMTVRELWGDNLEGLLCDESGEPDGTAASRVRGLLTTVQDIRNFFSQCLY